MQSAERDPPALRPPFEQALEETGRRSSHAAYLAITDAAATLQRQVSDLLSEHGLSLTQYSALRAIRRSDGIRLCDLSAEMVHRAPDASRLVERLVKLGMVERGSDGSDRRAVGLRLTRNAQDRLADIDRLLLQLHDRQLNACGDEEMQWLIRALTKLTSANAGTERNKR